MLVLVGFGEVEDDEKALAFDLRYEANKQANSRDAFDDKAFSLNIAIIKLLITE